MKVAVLSDIHANLQALHAVLADCERQGVEEFWLLGDYVNYGANPIECIKLLSELNVKYAIGGNHDVQHYSEVVPFTYTGSPEATEYTRRIISENPDKFTWLEEIAKVDKIHIPEIKTILVHGSLEEPYIGRIMPNANDRSLFAGMERFDVNILLCGHLHASFMVTVRGRTVINCGSVGQPRNNIPKAQYVILEDDNVTFRRVEYDVEEAVAAIQQAGLPKYLWELLYSG
jgi:putative phosphoesterase